MIRVYAKNHDAPRDNVETALRWREQNSCGVLAFKAGDFQRA
jgi:hypothetical protein